MRELSIREFPLAESKYGIKCPYIMNPTGITVHNTANSASAAAEVSYMQGNDNETSFHYAVDNIEAVNGIPLNRNSWHASDGGNGPGNRTTISIEICYSLHPDESLFDAAELNGALLVAILLRRYGWGIDAVQTHQHYDTKWHKYCPHKTLDRGWDRFLGMVQAYLNDEEPGGYIPVTPSEPVVVPPSTISTYDNPSPCDQTVTYQVYAGTSLLGNINNYDENSANDCGYAGALGKAITGVFANTTIGNVVFKVKGAGEAEYYPEVKDRTDYAGVRGTAIERLKMKLVNADGYQIEYRLAPVGEDYYPWVSGAAYDGTTDDDYAGQDGVTFDRLQIRIIKTDAVPVETPSSDPVPVEVPTVEAPVTTAIDVEYLVHTLNGRWLSVITNCDLDNPDNEMGYAGIDGVAIDAIAIRSTAGTVHYRVHTSEDGNLAEVCGFDTENYNDGYAGIFGHAIDGIEVRIEGVDADIFISASTLDHRTYYPEVKNREDYAGVYGQLIDCVRVRVQVR